MVSQLDCSLGRFELGWIGYTKSCLREIGGEKVGGVEMRGQNPVLWVSESGDKSSSFTPVGNFVDYKNAGYNLSNEDFVLWSLLVW